LKEFGISVLIGNSSVGCSPEVVIGHGEERVAWTCCSGMDDEDSLLVRVKT